MQKTILVTGSTDGIGFETAKMLVEGGHHVIVHGRNVEKVADVEQTLLSLMEENSAQSQRTDNVQIETIVADLSSIAAVDRMVSELKTRFEYLDVVINNAGIYSTAHPQTADGFDVRLVVNTFAPYRLTKGLMPLLRAGGRIVNLSSAAQAPVNLQAIAGQAKLSDGEAYAQSKLALTMWSRAIGLEAKNEDTVVVSVNPKSLLGSKMVKEAYGIPGSDLSVGADILVRAALSDEFSQAYGQYYDNDIGAFASPHSDALNAEKVQRVVHAIDEIIDTLS